MSEMPIVVFKNVCLIVHNTDAPFRRITPLTAYVEGTTKMHTRMITEQEHLSQVFGGDLIYTLPTLPPPQMTHSTEKTPR